MRVCVFGGGSIGGLLAAQLARDGREVSVVARGAHLRAMQSDGLRLRTPEGEFLTRPAATDDPAALGAQDLVVVATKTTALPQVAAAIGPLLHPGTRVAFAVNGVFWFYAHGLAAAPDVARLDPGGVLARAVGAGRALGIVVHASAEVVAPGLVVNPNGGRMVVGDAMPGASERAREVAAALACPGLAVTATDDLRRAMWAKLARNVGSSPIACLTGADSTAVAAVPALRRMAERLRGETLAVAAAQGYPGITLEAGRTVSPAPMKPSMLQDLERGRPLEIETQLAAVQDLGRQAGVSTPVLDTLLPLLVLRARVAGCLPAEFAARMATEETGP